MNSARHSPQDNRDSTESVQNVECVLEDSWHFVQNDCLPTNAKFKAFIASFDIQCKFKLF